MNSICVIEEWNELHPRRQALETVIESLGQMSWVHFQADWHQGSVILVAQAEGEVVGFLRFVLQEIGVEDDPPPVTWQGIPLIEAKILAFGVHKTCYRTQMLSGALP